jgi:transcriptional regulator with XRE-family HTH domain
MSKLGEVLRELRGKRSLRSVADITGLSHSYIADIEKGIRRDTKAPINPSPEILKRLANAYNYSYEELLKLAGYIEEQEETTEKPTYDPMSEINKMIKEFGIEQFGFFDIEKWKHFTPEDVEDLRKHFEWVAHKAKERNEEKK